MRQLFTFLVLLLGMSALQAQSAKDATVPMTATLNTGPTSITLTWANPGNANILIGRRTKGQAGNAWVQVVNVANSNLTSVTDNGVANGQTYEYFLQRQVGTIFAFGYAHVAINAAPVNSRGKILIFVDSTTADALGPELVRMKNDMRGDGWWPIPFHTGPSSTVQSIKNQIVASYNADPTNVKAVLLLGSVPIPYSGDSNWDGHPDHAGAWPADSYYADVNGVWTDQTINDVSPGRAANVNIPGDGKFDQSTIPTAVELQVGRVDFRHINATAFGAADQIGLMKRYLDKNHRWRIGDFPVSNKALVDDNFGYFGGEAFAANGFRNSYPVVGESNIIETDFFIGTESQSYLLGYGCGGGWYQGANGVGSSTDFATDSINIVFTNLFGSYFGDWDYESDPFMPSALASRGGILTCSWAGRPHWFNQAFASGETIGYCTKETMNAQFNNGFFGSFGESGAHVALLGDPTLRAHTVKPATNLTLAAPTCNSVVLNWTASAEAVVGYHVYRALSQDGPYTRLTTNTISGTTYTDNAPPLDTLYYQVRAIKNVSTPGGGTYANNAIGPIKSIVFTGAGGPTVTATGATLNCANLSVMLTATATPASISSWNWSGPNNYSSSQQNPTVSNPGSYTVTATDANGCSATATAIATGDFTAPTITATVSNTINCASNTATIMVNPVGLTNVIITGPGGFFVQGLVATVSTPGNYTVSATSSTNGCLGNAMVAVVSDMVIPAISTSQSPTLTCVTLATPLLASSNVPNSTFLWSGPCVNGATATCPGVYTVTVTNTSNGCTNSASTIVTQDIVPPSVAASSGVITCNNPSVALNATVAPGVTTVWSGPCIMPGNPPMATCAGAYTVVATNPTNGCTNSVATFVTANTQAPNIVLPPLPPLSCATPCIDFTVPNIPGIEIYIDGQLIPPGTAYQICQPGTYAIIVKSTANGCIQETTIIVQEDINVPVSNAGPDATISCSNPSVQLTSAGSSTGAAFSYLWTGPGGFSSTQPDPTVSAAGTYILMVTNNQNGCTSTDAVTVNADPSLPVVNATASGQLNCANSSVQLQSGNNDPNATYTWTPATGLSCTSCSNPTASLPGTYTVTVQVGACSATDAVDVSKAPDLVVNINSGNLSCDGILNICVAAIGGTPPYAVLWSNGTTTLCATYTAPALVNVKVSDNGGCVFQSQNINIALPPVIQSTVSVTNESAPNAHNGSIDLSVLGGAGPFTYHWSNNFTTQDLSGLSGGTYTVTITDVNGCTATTSATVSTNVGTEEALVFQQFLLSPNPTTGLASLSLKLNEAAPIRVEICDLTGRLIWEKSIRETSSLELPIDLSHQPAGTYALKVRIHDHIFVRKLAVVR